MRWTEITEAAEALDETWLTSINDGLGNEYDVFKNPSQAEAFKLIAADKYKQCRAIATADDLYIVSSDVTHYDLSEHLGLDRDATARIFLDRSGPYLNEDDAMARVGQNPEDDHPWDVAQRKLVDELAHDHPILKRIYGAYTLGVR